MPPLLAGRLIAVIDRRAEWSDGFVLPGQQPIAALPPYDAAAGDGGIRTPRALAELGPAALQPPSADPLHDLNGWPEKFDYVLVLGAGTAAQAARHGRLVQGGPMVSARRAAATAG